MQVNRNRVNYTEVKVVMEADEVREVLAEHMRVKKGVVVVAADVEFDVAVMEDDVVKVNGVVATILKRGRALRKEKTEVNGEPEEPKKKRGRPKKEVVEDSEEEAPKKKRGRPKKKLEKVEVDLDDEYDDVEDQESD